LRNISLKDLVWVLRGIDWTIGEFGDYSKIVIIRFLIRHLFAKLPISLVATETGISRPMIYRAAENSTLIEITDGIHLRLDIPTLRTKLAFDEEWLLTMNKQILGIVKKIRELKEVELAILSGSFARKKAGPDSDVDVLIVSRNKKIHLPCDLTIMTPEEFNLQYTRGNDFITSSLAWGIVIKIQSDYEEYFLRRPPEPHSSICEMHEKLAIEKAKKALKNANRIAREYAKSAIIHYHRAKLCRKGYNILPSNRELTQVAETLKNKQMKKDLELLEKNQWKNTVYRILEELY